MHALLCFRLASFVLFALFGILNIAFAAWNLAVVGPASTRVQSSDIYTLTFNTISLLTVGGMLITEQVRTGSPRLWLEMTWVGCFAVLSLGSAAIATTLMPVTACGMTQAKMDPQFCVSGNAVVATSWINTIIYLGWFITVIIYGTTRSCSDRDIWFKGIKDVDLRPNNIPDPTINEKIARLPALHHRPEVRTSEYSVSTVKMEKDDVSIVMPYHHRNGPIGVNAINGTPAYHPYSTTNTWNQWNAEQSRTTTPASVSTRPADSPQTIEAPPRRPFIVARPHGMSTGRSSIPSANAGSNRSSDIEWVNNTYRNTDSPSPAVIMQAHKVPAQQVLYGAHITGTKEKRRTRSNTDPAREGWLAAPSREQRNQSSILLVNDRRPSEAGVGLSPQISMGSAPMFSTDSAFGVKPKKPKHRPPPLDLSRLSNIKQAERR